MGGVSVLGIVWFFNHYGVAHLFSAIFILGSGIFYLVSSLEEGKKYHNLNYYIPVGVLGILATIYMVYGGAEEFIGYILIPLFLFLSLKPIVINKSKNA